MVIHSDEYYLYRILSGKISITYDQQPCVIGIPSFDDLSNAERIYTNSLRNAQLLGALSTSELLLYMVDHNLWSPADEEHIETLPEQIDNIKLDIYNTYIKLQDTYTKRCILDQLNEQYNILLKKKNKYIALSCEGIAEFHKVCYLLCSAANLDYYNSHLYQIYYEYLQTTITSDHIRKLARSPSWHHYWTNIKYGNNIFNSVLTIEQQSLLGWSKFYDNVHDSSECPSDDVITDDVLLDGWCIDQKNKRKQEDREKLANNFGNSGEIFVMAENEKHARRINELNDAKAKLIRRQQSNMIKQRGQVMAQDMPDVKMELKQKATQMFRDKIRGK